MNKKRYVISIALCVLLLSNVATATSTINNNKTTNDERSNYYMNTTSTIYVDDDADPGWYDETHVKTINEGITNASEGDKIFVFNGTYSENLILVNKSISLVGEDKETTIIDETGSKQGIYITADNVNISGFTIKNVTVEWWDRSGITIKGNKTRVFNNIITNNRRGMLLYEVYGVIVEDNLFLENHNIHPGYDSYNLQLDKSYDNIISGNNFINEKTNVVICIDLIGSDNNLICNNSFTELFNTVLYLDNSDNNTIRNNDIVDSSQFGIQLKGSNQNDIHHNNIENNFQGISLRGSDYNKIHHNNFIKCFIKATFTKSSFNRWYQNYWGRPRILPKIIFGTKGIIGFIPWFNIDLFPAKKPYEI